jgi:cell wall-associated NlpC family hydrolase
MLNRLLAHKRVSINTTRLAQRVSFQRSSLGAGLPLGREGVVGLTAKRSHLWLLMVTILVQMGIPWREGQAALTQDSKVLTTRATGSDFGSVLDKYSDYAKSPDPETFGVSGQTLMDVSRVGPNRVIPMPAVLDQLLLYRGKPVGGMRGTTTRGAGDIEPTGPSSQEAGSASDGSLSGIGGRDFYQRQLRLDHEEVRQTLLKVAEEFGEEAQYVPYVWGGNQIGDTKACQACRSCIAKKSRLKVEKRKSVCKPCQQCGIDCSHFVHRVFQDAGLEFPYTNTASLQRMSPMTLLEDLRLVDIGRDLRQVRPGDLLLKKKHIVVLLRTGEQGRGDVIHVSRSTRKMGPGGGIEIARDVDLTHFAGKLVKILRHKDTMLPDSSNSTSPNTRSVLKNPNEAPAQGSPEDPREEKGKNNPLLWGPGEFMAHRGPLPPRSAPEV